MAGLFGGLLANSADDPRFAANMALAGGLLEGNFGAGLRGYAKSLAEARQDAMREQFAQLQMEGIRSQIADRQSEIEARRAAQAKQQGIMDAVQGLFKPAVSPGAFMPSAGDMGPTMPPSMAALASPASAFASTGIDRIAAIKAMGGPDLVEAFKWANDPLKLEQGSTYRDRTTGQERYMPKVGEGIAPNASGFYAPLPGYSRSLAELEAVKAGATERARADLDPVKVVGNDGGEYYKPRSEVVAPKRSPIPVAQTGTATDDQRLIYEGEMRDARARLSKATTATEVARAQQDIAGLTREMQRLGIGADQGGGYQASKTTAQKAEEERAVKTAQADVERDSARQADTKRYGQMTAGVDRAIELLKQGPTESGAGALVDAATGFLGMSNKGADLASQLDTLSGWLTANTPRMEGPQSNVDVQNYRIMAGMVGDRTKPVSQRLAAAQEVKALQEKYAALNGKANQGGASGGWEPTAPEVGAVMDGYRFRGGNPADPKSWVKQ